MKNILITIMIVTSIMGCTTTESNEAALQEAKIMEIYGSYNGGEFVNNYYGFKLQIPETYTIQNDEMKKHIADVGANVLYGDEKSALEQTDIAAEETYNILIASKYEIGAPVSENIIFMILSENLTYLPGIKNGADYLWSIQKQLKDSDIGLFDESEFLQEEINGINFHTFKYGIKMHSVTVYQKWYVKKVKEHMLCFALTNITDEGFVELEKIIQTISLLDKTDMKNLD